MATKKAKVYKPHLGKPKAAHVAGALRQRKKPRLKRIVYKHVPKGFTI
jgi:hypothetical protein